MFALFTLHLIPDTYARVGPPLLTREMADDFFTDIDTRLSVDAALQGSPPSPSPTVVRPWPLSDTTHVYLYLALWLPSLSRERIYLHPLLDSTI